MSDGQGGDAPPYRPPAPRTGGRVGTLLAVAAAVALVVVWGAAALGPYVGLPAAGVPVVALLPYASVVLVVGCFAVWTAVPDHPLGPWLLAAATVAPLAWWGPTWPARAPSAEGAPLRVMTWNVRRLWGTGPVPRDMQPVEGVAGCVADEVDAQAPDVVVLQEVTAADLDALSPPLGLTCTFGTYRGVGAPTEPGVAVCVRGAGWTADVGEAVPFDATVDWRFVELTVRAAAAPDHAVRVVGVHLQPHRLLDDPVRRLGAALTRVAEVHAAQQVQARRLLDRAAVAPAPVVLAGDFNSTPDLPLHAWLRRAFVDTWAVGAQGLTGTVRVFGLSLRIDLIYADPSLGVASAWVPDTHCSDHRPAVAELRVPPQP